MRRRFFAFSPRFLQQVARTLLAEHRRGNDADLSTLTIGLPTRRSAVRLGGHLRDLARRNGIALIEPGLHDPPALVDSLLPQPPRAAGRAARETHWMRALRDLDPARRRALTVEPPFPEHLSSWAALARRLDTLADELAEEDLDFATVAARIGDASPDTERARWDALRLVEEAMLASLAEADVIDPRPWRRACLREGRVREHGRVLWVGIADPPGSLRTLALHLGDRVEAWVHAPDASSDAFDDVGGIDVVTWASRALAIEDARMEVVDDPPDQARAACAWWRAGDPGATIAIGDEETLPFLRDLLDEGAADDALGEPVERTALFSLLSATIGLLRGQTFDDLATLARQPAVWSMLVRAHPDDDPLVRLDDYARRHLPARLRDLPAPASIEGIVRAVRGMVDPFEQGAAPPAVWMPRIVIWCRELAGPGPALDSIAAAASGFAGATSAQVGGAEALDLLRGAWSGDRLVHPAPAANLHVIAWNELALDESPRVAVSGLQEGSIPAHGDVDPFLPDGLRARLGLPDHRRRLARDAYMLASMLESGRDVRLIAGRRSSTGDPLKPSRLLLATEGEALARRILLWTSPSSSKAAWKDLPSGTLAATFREPPRPEALPVPEVLSVTALRDYLTCPYRFYLRHVCGLRRRHDHHLELDAAAFGSIAHEALMALGAEDARASADAVRLTDLLETTLQSVARRRFGHRPRAAVQVQLAQLRTRLQSVARWQAERARRGWMVDAVEVDLQAALDVDGIFRPIRARVDRIDRHRDTGQIAILDYKTADAPRTPQQAHVDAQGNWIDLQLPLYSWLHESRFGASPLPCELAYVAIPRDPWQVTYHVATWTPRQMGRARDVARDALRSIHQGVFWPPRAHPPAHDDDYSVICLDDVQRIPPLRDEATA